MFKGKAINYHTEVTATKGEQILVWIVTIVAFICAFASFVLINNIGLKVLCMFLSIMFPMIIMIIIIFSPSHEEERKENEIITKVG